MNLFPSKELSCIRKCLSGMPEISVFLHFSSFCSLSHDEFFFRFIIFRDGTCTLPRIQEAIFLCKFGIGSHEGSKKDFN